MIISTSARHNSDKRTTHFGRTVTASTQPTTLSAAQVAGVIASVNSMNGTLNAGQLASLRKELSAPNQH